jgi:hypothetical protein
MSPSALKISIVFNSANGSSLGETSTKILTSPSNHNFEIDIKEAAKDAGIKIEALNSFTVQAIPVSGNTPTRINHQIVYRQSAIESSINISLQNYNVLHSKSKARTSWGQIVNSPEFDTWLSITNDGYEDPISTVEVKIFDENGYVGSETVSVPMRTATTIDVAAMLLGNHFVTKGEFLWYEIECPNYFLTAFSISRHVKSNHCTGEHSF